VPSRPAAARDGAEDGGQQLGFHLLGRQALGVELGDGGVDEWIDGFASTKDRTVSASLLRRASG
jgi:hypothetical protein